MAKVHAGARKIVLVRHALPVIDPQRPAGEWMLAPQSAESIVRLARRLREFNPDSIVSSPEQKALGTAQVMADELGLMVTDDDTLREQGSNSVPWYEMPSDFRRAVANHFALPTEVVLGNESSNAAVERLCDGVQRASRRNRFPVLVTHGRVMCGLIGRVVGRSPMEYWAELRLPDAFVLDLDERTAIRVRRE